MGFLEGRGRISIRAKRTDFLLVQQAMMKLDSES